MINKPLKSPENFIRPRWISISLKEKFSAFAAAVVLTTALSALLNLFMANFAFHGFGTILDDNAKCYRFQTAISQETQAFNTYVRDKNADSLKAYHTACEETEAALSSLPFSYGAIGGERYAKTWSIRNAYESYVPARDKAAAMASASPDYVDTLYEAFGLQGYLAQYAGDLTALTLEAGNSDYLQRLPILRALPWCFLVFGAGLTWLVLRFLRGMAEAEGTRLVSAVSALLTGCALVLSLGAGAALAGDWRAAAEEAQAGNTGNAGFTVAVLGVLALLRLGPYLLGAAALLWGGRLVDQAGREPFARETAELCDRAAYACRTAAQGSVLLSLTVNLIQLALFDLLVQSNFSVSLDLLPLALAGAMFLLSRWMRQGLALREDNDSII